MNIDTDKLLEPLNYYYDEIKNNFRENIEKFFDELVSRTNIDIEFNEKISIEYEELLKEKEKITEKFNFLKKIDKFILIIAIICVVIVIYNIFLRATYSLTGLFISALLGIAFFLLHFIYFSNKLNDIENIILRKEEECKSKLTECLESMKELNNLMDSKYTFELINRNIPFVKLDPYFIKKRFEDLYYVYGLSGNEDINYSTLEAVSGDILGNPFVLLKELEHKIIDKIYEGSLVIHWTEYYTDANGKRQSRNRSQTLHASVKKPAPNYSKFVSLIFGSDVAENLYFYREPDHVERLSKREIEKKIKKEEKNLRKLEEKSIKEGKTFVALSNTEFEVLFNALNRDNESEFRLLFTPLAQKNMVNLLKNKEYGDNFYFLKDRKINKILAEHTKNWDLDFNVNKFRNYSFRKSKEFFVKFNEEYFNNFFFTLAPLISIPLYQQYMSRDYIYGSEFKNNYNPYTAESLANAIGDYNFSHNQSKTISILKSSPMLSKGKTDLMKITAYSYDIEKRVDYVSVYGGDGYYHDVPVYWDEYIPLTNVSTMEIKNLDIDDIDFEKITQEKNNSEIFEKDKYVYKNKIFAKVTNKDFIETENILNSILEKININ